MVIAPTTILMFVGLVGAAALVALALYRKFILHGSAKRPLVGAVLAAAVFVASAGAIQINAGYVGVVRYFGAAAPGELQPGLHFVMPLVTTVEMVDTRVQALPFDNLEGASKEYQPIMLTGVLNITVVPDRADELVQRVGTDWAAKIVFPAYANIVKEVLPQYGIAEILPRRDEIRTQTIARLKENIEARYGLTVNDIYLSNITFTQAYIDAIVAKQVAEQETLRQAQLVQAETQKARQAEVIAMGQAAAAIAIAQGEARANALIAESLTAEVLQSRYIDKLADDVRVIIVPSDGGNFLWNMADLTGGQGAKPSPSASPAPSPVAPAPSPVAPAPTPVAPPANQPGNQP
jgi:regulator of protease activity HflC (stomatin/prohibitin superfamily)